MQSYIDALNNSTFVAEYDTSGYVTSINNSYLEFLGLTRDEIVGTHHSFKLELSPENQREYDKFWVDLKNGMIRKELNYFNIDSHQIALQETYSPIKNELGHVYKILKIATNFSDLKKKKTK